MADVIDLDVQVAVSNENGTPSTNFETRWHDLVLVIEELRTELADHEIRIDDLENP